MEENSMEYKRYAGVLVHPTSFPGKYGIGDLGKEAYEFVDFMERSGLTIWQVLPLGHTGFGDSPYQPFSSFAGQPLLIALDPLRENGLLLDEDFNDMPQWNSQKVEYGKVIEFKTRLLKKAFERYIDPDVEDDCSTDEEFVEAYDKFKSDSKWLDDYALFMAAKDYFQGMPWYMWEDSIKKPNAKQKSAWMEKLSDKIEYYRFIQFLFHKQWFELKEYANEKDIKIIGDIPIFVAWDSVDVWANKKLFDLDSKGYPKKVAGVPPDFFSATGQLWGNPLYKWSEHTKTGYEWWISRISHQLEIADYVRLDHFRAFDKYWAVPYGEETAIKGKWTKAPGVDFMTHLESALGHNMPIIAEDLGFIEQSVLDLRERFNIPGMKILQFGFGNLEDNDYLPHNCVRNCICYTSTHDNDTMVGWYRCVPEQNKDRFRRYFNTDGNDVSWTFICACFSSVANMAIVPMQDILSLDSWSRYNVPGVGDGNWAWRFKHEDMNPYLEKRLFETAKLYGRAKDKEEQEEQEED